MSSEGKGLRFKEYNPEEIKKQLPEGYSPLESLPVSVDFSRNTTIKVHGFANAKEANDFMNYLAPQFISSCKLTKGMKSAVEYEYQLIAPYQLPRLCLRSRRLRQHRPGRKPAASILTDALIH